MAKSNSKRSKSKGPKKAAPKSGMVTKSTGAANYGKASSFIANKSISSSKKGNSVSTPRKAG
jgi:hypothetical protein